MFNNIRHIYYTGMDKTCVYTSFYGFICVSRTDCVQFRYRHIRQAAIPARVVLGTAVFCDQSNQYLVYEFPFCAMHMRVSSVSLPYLQNRLPSLIISVCTPGPGFMARRKSDLRSKRNAIPA